MHTIMYDHCRIYPSQCSWLIQLKTRPRHGLNRHWVTSLPQICRGRDFTRGYRPKGVSSIREMSVTWGKLFRRIKGGLEIVLTRAFPFPHTPVGTPGRRTFVSRSLYVSPCFLFLTGGERTLFRFRQRQRWLFAGPGMRQCQHFF